MDVEDQGPQVTQQASRPETIDLRAGAPKVAVHPDYDLSAAAAEVLIAELRGRPELRDLLGDFVVGVSSGDPAADVARRLERRVLDGQFGSATPYTPDFMLQQYGDYEAHSYFFMFFDEETSSVVSMMRVIDGLDQSKSFGEVAKLCSKGSELTLDQNVVADLRREKIWDVATICTDPGYRGVRATPAVYNSMYSVALARGIDKWVCVLDAPYWEFLDLVGLPMRSLLSECHEFLYLGCESVAVEIDINATADSMVRSAATQPTEIREVIAGMLTGNNAPPFVNMTGL